MGDDHLLPPEDHRDQGIPRGTGFLELSESLTGQPVVVLEIHPEESGPTPGELKDVENSRVADDPHDPVADVAFGVDDQIDLQPRLLRQPSPVLHLVGAHPGNLDTGFGFDLRDQAGQNIDPVGIRRGDEHLGFGEAGAAEGQDTGGIALDDLRVQGILEVLAPLDVLFYKDDFVAFSDEATRNEGGNVSASGNQNSHRYRLLTSGSGRAGRIILCSFRVCTQQSSSRLASSLSDTECLARSSQVCHAPDGT